MYILLTGRLLSNVLQGYCTKGYKERILARDQIDAGILEIMTIW